MSRWTFHYLFSDFSEVKTNIYRPSLAFEKAHRTCLKSLIGLEQRKNTRLVCDETGLLFAWTFDFALEVTMIIIKKLRLLLRLTSSKAFITDCS